MRGATARIPETKINCSISIHAPHAGRDRLLTAKTKSAAISIHAPHAGRDGTSAIGLPSYGHFNPRAPCGARPVQQAPPAARYNRFQSTRPMRGATVTRVVTLVTIVISIHAPHAGRDKTAPCRWAMTLKFQSTRPMRGATKSGSPPCYTDSISIHAPHAGCDPQTVSILI